jgi:hypothetical protein
MPVHCQCVLWADVPAINCFKGSGFSEKVTQDHEIVRKIGKRTDNQYEVSAICNMGLEGRTRVNAEHGYLKSRSRSRFSVSWREIPKF